MTISILQSIAVLILTALLLTLFALRYDPQKPHARYLRHGVVGLLLLCIWNLLPLPKPLQGAVYGISGSSHGPYFLDQYGQVQIPEIEKGKFYFLDREAGDTPVPKSWVSLNADHELHFTLAIWDSETNMLYFFMKDT